MAEAQRKPRISMIVPLPVSLLLIVFFFLPWLTISCDVSEFTTAMQSSNAPQMPITLPASAMPEITAEVGQASGRQLAEGDISLKGAYARQDNGLDSENRPLKSRSWLYLGLVLPILALLLGGLGAAGKGNAGKVGAGLLLLGIVGTIAMSVAASIDYVDDAINKLGDEAAKQSGGAAPCAKALAEAKGQMKRFIKTRGTVFLWSSLGMYVLLGGCGIAARTAPLVLGFERDRASLPAVVGSRPPERMAPRGAGGLPDFGPDLTPRQPARQPEDAAAPAR